MLDGCAGVREQRDSLCSVVGVWEGPGRCVSEAKEQRLTGGRAGGWGAVLG